MKPEAQKIAIAEVCGWVFHKLTREYSSYPHWRLNGLEHDLPDYLNDLNAMHDAEATLSEHEQARYQDVLAFAFVGSSEHYPLFSVIHATSACRAEAFLRTLGEWRDE